MILLKLEDKYKRERKLKIKKKQKIVKIQI